jgi:hypothetical protein
MPKEEIVSDRLSVAEILAHLEGQMAFHQQQKALHVEREAFHREQAAHHDAEFEVIARHYEAFKATAGAAAEIAARTASPAPAAPPEDDLPPGRPVIRSRLVARVVANIPADYTFTASWLAAEVNRRFGKALRKPADARLAAAALRRMAANGTVRVAQPGTSHRETVYSRV